MRAYQGDRLLGGVLGRLSQPRLHMKSVVIAEQLLNDGGRQMHVRRRNDHRHAHPGFSRLLA